MTTPSVIGSVPHGAGGVPNASHTLNHLIMMKVALEPGELSSSLVVF